LNRSGTKLFIAAKSLKEMPSAREATRKDCVIKLLHFKSESGLEVFGAQTPDTAAAPFAGWRTKWSSRPIAPHNIHYIRVSVILAPNRTRHGYMGKPHIASTIFMNGTGLSDAKKLFGHKSSSKTTRINAL